MWSFTPWEKPLLDLICLNNADMSKYLEIFISYPKIENAITTIISNLLINYTMSDNLFTQFNFIGIYELFYQYLVSLLLPLCNLFNIFV